MGVLGKYYSKEGIYAFPDANGVMRHYKAHWLANPYNMSIPECKSVLETAYDAGSTKWQKGILICAKAKWLEIAKNYESWVGLAQLHCFDTTVPAGTVPSWAAEFNGYGGFLIHEYQPSKVMFMRDPKDIYIFFVDSAPPAGVDPVNPPADETPGDTTPTVPGIPSIPGVVDLNIHIYDHSREKVW